MLNVSRMKRLLFMTTPTNPEAGGGTPPTPPEPPKPPPGDDPPKDDPKPEGGLNEGGMKALKAERDARAKAEKDLADLRKEIEDSKKSAEQKAADDLAEAQKAAAEASARAMRFEVAAAKGLDLKLAARLQGSTKEELEADADVLLVDIKPAHEPPAPDPSQGSGGDNKHKSLDDAIAAHYSKQ